MNKVENNPLGLFDPSDDSSTEETSVIKEHLQNAGFSKTDSEWLVDVFKHRDCFGDPNGAPVFREDFTDFFEQLFPTILEKLTEAVQIEKDRQTSLALLLSRMLKLGIVGNYPTWFLPNVERKESDNASDVPEWVHEFQKHAKFSAQNLEWHQLTERTYFDDLLPFLLPEGVPLDQTVDINLLDPIPRRNWSSNDLIDPKHPEFWLIWRFRDEENRRENVRLDTLLPIFSGFPDDVLGDKILGLLNAIYDAMTRASWGVALGRPLRSVELWVACCCT